MPPLRPRALVVAAASLAVALGFTGTAAAQTSEGWAQFQGGSTHAGAVGDGPAPGYVTAWTSSTDTGGPRGAYGLSAPVFGDGVVVAVGPTQVVAYDVVTGDVAWEIERALGPSVAPAIAGAADGDLVLFTEGWAEGPPDASETPTPSVSGTGEPSPSPAGEGETPATATRLVAAPVGGGDATWTVDLPVVSRTGVTVADDTAIVGSIDGTVTAADVATGSTVWTAELGGFVESPVTAADDHVLVSVRGDDDTATAVVALSLADGSESWRFEPTTTAFAVGPASVDGDSGYVALADGTVHAFSLADGTERWRTFLNAYVNPFSPASPPVIVGDAVIVVDVRGQLYRLDAQSGDRVWDHAYNRAVLRSTPVAVGDHVVVATSDGNLAAFELASGDLVWQGPAGDDAATSPLRGLAVDDDLLVVVRGGTGAGVVAFEHDPSAALVREVSPTILDAPTLLMGWAVALAIAAALFVAGRLLWARLGAAEIPTDDDSRVEGEA